MFTLILSFFYKSLQTLYQNKRQVLSYMTGAIIVLGFIQGQFQLVMNMTESLPQPYFLQIKSFKPKVGDYTLTWNGWLQRYVIKQVVGQAGDPLRYDKEGCLWVNDFRVGKPQPTTREGRSLTPLLTGIIPKGYVFLYARALRSFDSRYQEFGLVPLAALQGRLFPITKFWSSKP